MTLDTDRLVQIARELKTLDERRDKLLAELQGIAGGGTPAAPRRGRPHGSRTQASVQGAAPAVRRGPGRPPRSSLPAVAPSRAELVVSRRPPKKGLTTAIVEFLVSTGGAHTAGDIVARRNLPATKRQNWSVSNALVRLVKEGRVKKDKVRGYRAA